MNEPLSESRLNALDEIALESHMTTVILGLRKLGASKTDIRAMFNEILKEID